jgi:hypothetical protein
VDARASLDNVEKRKFLTLLGFELRPLGRPAHSQSLYRLRYPSSQETLVISENTEKRAERKSVANYALPVLKLGIVYLRQAIRAL